MPEGWARRLQRAVLPATLVLSAVGFWYGSYDVFHTFKATAVAVGAIGLAGLSAARASVRGRVERIRHLARWPLLAFLGALVFATAVSAEPMRAVVGRPGRHTGLAMYVLYVALFCVALRLYRTSSPTPLLKSLIVAAVPVTVYGIWQAAGFDPLLWSGVIGGPASTFGNANFFSAWLGIVIPLCVWAALARELSGEWRGWASVIGIGAAVAAVLSGSLQGPLTATVGTGFVVVVALWPGLSGKARHAPARWWTAVMAVLLSGAALIIAVAVGVGPLAALRADIGVSVANRIPLWSTGLAVFWARPLTGVGLDAFGDWWYRYRPDELAARTGPALFSDSPHSVPLDMFASGGVVLGLSYLAVVGVTAWTLVSGLRRLDGDERLLLAGVGGAWVAYQVQSLLSIDVPPLAVLHWVLAGIIVARGGRRPPPVDSIELRWQPLAAGSPTVTMARLTLAFVVLGGFLVVGWTIAIQPFRADVIASQAGLVEDPPRAEALYAAASRIAFWEPLYPLLEGDFLDAQGRPEDALTRYEAAAERNPRELSAHLGIARLAADLQEHERAIQAYQAAVHIDPKSPGILAEAGEYLLSQGHAAEALTLLERAVSASPSADAWAQALQRARMAAGGAGS